MNAPIVQPEPFWPVASLEREVDRLRRMNAALTDDQTALCNLLADKNREVALLQAELAKLKRSSAGVYHLRATRRSSGRYVAQQRNR